MARATRHQLAPSASFGSLTQTQTLTLGIPSSSSSPSPPPSSSSSQQPREETLVLRLKPKKKKVTWKEGTVDNEFLNRKSSKKCCIFHKEKPFDEDDSDDENGNHAHDCDHHTHGKGCGWSGLWIENLVEGILFSCKSVIVVLLRNHDPIIRKFVVLYGELL